MSENAKAPVTLASALPTLANEVAAALDPLESPQVRAQVRRPTLSP
jgi:hypothetical protein